MKGLIKITAAKGRKIISSEVYGDLAYQSTLLGRLMNRHKIIHSERNLWKILDVKLIKQINQITPYAKMESKIKFRDYQNEIIKDGTSLLKKNKFLYLAMEVRTGKTLTSLGILDKVECKNVLFITKKKAISSIEGDYNMLKPSYNIVVINYESLHNVDNSVRFDAIVCDEAHSMGAFPKPSLRAKQVKDMILKNKDPYVILLSGTPTPESYGQMYHQVYGIKNNPFSSYKNFYRFCDTYVNVTERKINTLTLSRE